MTSVDLNENSVINIPDDIQTVGGKKMHALDPELSSTSENPVQNKAIKAQLDALDAKIDGKETPVDGYTIKKGQGGKLYGVGYGVVVNRENKGELFNVNATGMPLPAGLGSAAGKQSHGEGSHPTADGDYSHAEGYYGTATGEASHAEGHTTTASGDNSHVEGNTTTASGDNSHAEGYQTTASGNNSHAEGNTARASGSNSHAEGYYAAASGDNSHAEGSSTLSSGGGSHAEGYYAAAYGTNSHAEGYGNTLMPAEHLPSSVVEICSMWQSTKNQMAYGDYSHAEGSYCAALGSRSHAEGEFNLAFNTQTHAEGYQTAAYGQSSHSEGYGGSIFFPAKYGTTVESLFNKARGQASQTNVAFGFGSHSEGYNCMAGGSYSHAEGEDTATYNYGAHSEGYNTTAYGSYSHAEGRSANQYYPDKYGSTLQDILSAVQTHGRIGIAFGDNAHSEGYDSIAGGITSHAEGRSTTASGRYSHSEGYESTASEEASHAEGRLNTASNYASHAEGEFSVASGYVSHVEGSNNIASGNYSHAEGSLNEIAGSVGCHGEGYKNNIVSGMYSHAEGNNNKILDGISIHVEGGYNEAAGEYNHISGILNNIDGKYVFATGSLNGTSELGYCAFIAGQRNIANQYSTAIGTNLISREGQFVVGASNAYGGQSPALNFKMIYKTDPLNNDKNLVYSQNYAIVKKDDNNNTLELVMCLAGYDSSLVKSEIKEVLVNGVLIDENYYSLDSSSGITDQPDLSQLRQNYLIIDANGFTEDQNDQYTISITLAGPLGDINIFSIGNGPYAADEDCDNLHRANAVAVTYDGNMTVQNNIYFKYKDSSDNIHKISAQKMVDALLSLGINISDLEVTR